ncbi:MAG: GGDEF domain-containing protein [Planctomycetota bacterium]|jgi:diguanylate cyclase (GGDEF)-like protein
MARQRASVFRSLVTNVWLMVCVMATASCTVLAVQLLLRRPPLDAQVLSIRLALGVPASFGALAGIYGIVMTVVVAVRTAKLGRLQRRLRGLRRRSEELEALQLKQRVRLDQLATLREVATVVNQESDFGIIAEKVLELINGLLEPLETTIFIRHDTKPKMVPFAQIAAGKVLRGRKVLTRSIPNFTLSDFESHSVICRIHGQEFHAIVPLKVQDAVHGMLLLVFPTDERPAEAQIAGFNETRRNVLVEVSHHISLAVKTKHLRTRAVVDSLTRLYTRSHFNSQLQASVELAQRNREAFALILIDIDHFKRVNDTYGHATGDVVLTRVAKRIRGALRKYDTAYRYGGEELAVLLPRTRMKQATQTAERLRTAIEARKFRGPNGRLVKVTVSLGVAQFEPTDDGESLFGRADRRLYRAKQEGRNRVVPAAA